MGSKDLQKKVRNFLFSLNENKKECSREGHKDIVYYPYVISSNSSLSDKVNGSCNYCLTSVTRPLNPTEREQINTFYENLRNH